MSDDIGIGVNASGADGVNKLIASLDRLDKSITTVGTNTALVQLSRQMELMQASMTTGFAELAALAQKSGERQVAERTKSNDRLLKEQVAYEAKQHASANKFHDRTLTDQLAFEAKQAAQANKFHESVLAADALAQAKQKALAEKQQYDLAVIRGRADLNAGAEWEKFLAADAAGQAKQRALAQKQQVELATIRAQADRLAGQEWEKFLAADRAGMAKQKALAEKQQYDLAAIRARADKEAGAAWEKFLAADRAGQARQLAMAQEQQYKLYQIKEAGLERERALNTTYMTANLAQQIATAEKAAAYASLGGNASLKYGSMASGADLAVLRAQYAQLRPAAEGAAAGTRAHNAAMNEAHALARGLAGSLGGLWLTYGSIVPLLAGAAIAGSLKKIVEAGKEVEHQLNFVFSLSEKGQAVNLDQFLRINDSSLRSVSESANAMRALAQNGLEASQALQVLPGILDLATVGEMSVAQAAIAATGATSAFGLSFAEAGRVADIFAKTAATSNTSVLAITESMKQASTVASLFKVSIEETAGMLGLLAKINIVGGAAGTSFTNMLTGLYEPTEKGKRALKELGVETQTASGAIKPLTQLLDEMKSALANVNDAARVDILGSIFTVRGVKSAELALQNLDEFKNKTREAGEASGYMREVVTKLENDTEGAFKRLSVSVENTFVRAFAQAAPYVQQLGLHLSDMFKAEGSTDTALSNFATNVARLTGALVENLGVVTTLVAAYLGFRALGPVIALLNTATAATAASTVATAAATAASVAHVAAQSAGAGTLLLYTAAMEAQAAATVAATTATAAWSAVLLPALAALAIALAAGAALWLLFRDNTNEADQTNTKISNSLHVITEQLDKEIARLERSNELWDVRAGKFREVSEVTPEAVAQAQDAVALLEGQIRAAGGNAEDIRRRPMGNPTAGRGSNMDLFQFQAYANALKEADTNLKGLTEQQERFNNVAKPLTALEGVRKTSQQLGEDLEKFAKRGTEKNAAGDYYQQSEAIRSLYGEASKLNALRLDPEQILPDTKAETERLDGLRVSYKQLQDQVNALQGGRAPKVDKKAANDAFRGSMEALTGEQQKATDDAKKAVADLDSLYKRGEVSALERFQRERDLKVASLQQDLDIFTRKESLALTRENSEGIRARIENQRAATSRKIIEENAALENRSAEEINKAVQATTAYKIEELKKQGKAAEAYALENADRNKRLDQNISTATATVMSAQAGGDPAKIETASAALRVFLDLRAQYANTADQVAADEAMTNASKAFALALTQTKVGLDELVQQTDGGAGLASTFNAARTAAEMYAAALPDLIAKQKDLQALADSSKKPEDQKAATTALGEIDAQGTRVRKLWSDVGTSISKSLTDAFGAGGKAVGGLVKAYNDYGAKRESIDRALAKTSDPRKQADLVREGASAQLNAYGDMAGAAKGFFSEQSRGYKALEAAQRVFQLADMAMTLEAMATKLFATTTVTAARVTASTVEAGAAVATVPVVVAAEGVKASAYGVTALAAALALPFPASLPAFALVAGMLAAIGVVVGGMGGSSGPSLSEARQKATGTGTVLGDKDAKSESIANSLKLVADNTFRDVSVSYNMLAALRSIDSSLSGLGSLLVRGGLTGKTAPDYTTTSLGSAVRGGAALGVLFGPLAGAVGATVALLGGVLSKLPIIGGVIGKITSSIFGGKVSVEDTGLTAGKTSLGQVLAGGKINTSQYTDTKTSGGWFSSDKRGTTLKDLGAETDTQFSLIVKNLGQGIKAAADVLGLGGDAFSQKLNSFVVDIGKISTKGLTGDEIQKQLEAAFSKLGDDMANFAVSGLAEFQKVGEGTYETLVRIANDYATVDAVLQSFGKTFGAVGMGSVAARERLIEFSGGLEEFTSQGSFFLENFFTDAEKAKTLREMLSPTLRGLNNGADVTSMEQFKNLALAQDLTTESGARTYATLMSLAQAFQQLIEYGDEAGNKIKTLQEILDERKELQSQLDELTLSSAELRAKERLTLDESNRALYDQIAARKDIAEAYARESEALQDTLGKLQAFKKTVDEFRDSLSLGELSTLTPVQKAAEAKRQYEETLALARSGDESARSKLTGAASTYLTADQTIRAGTDAYAAEVLRVQQDMADLSKILGDQITDTQKQLDLMKAQVDLLTNINQNTISLKDAILALGASLRAGGQTDTTAGMYDGSFAVGLPSVPRDNFRALLHKDEAIIDAQSVSAISRYFGVVVQSGGSGGGNSDAMMQAMIESNERLAEKLDEVALYLAESNEEALKKTAEAISQGTKDAADAAIYASKMEDTVK